MRWGRKWKRLDDPTARFKITYIRSGIDRSQQLRVGDTVTFEMKVEVNGQVIELEDIAAIERTS